MDIKNNGLYATYYFIKRLSHMNLNDGPALQTFVQDGMFVNIGCFSGNTFVKLIDHHFGADNRYVADHNSEFNRNQFRALRNDCYIKSAKAMVGYLLYYGIAASLVVMPILAIGATLIRKFF